MIKLLFAIEDPCLWTTDQNHQETYHLPISLVREIKCIQSLFTHHDDNKLDGQHSRVCSKNHYYCHVNDSLLIYWRCYLTHFQITVNQYWSFSISTSQPTYLIVKRVYYQYNLLCIFLHVICSRFLLCSRRRDYGLRAMREHSSAHQPIKSLLYFKWNPRCYSIYLSRHRFDDKLSVC